MLDTKLRIFVVKCNITTGTAAILRTVIGEGYLRIRCTVASFSVGLNIYQHVQSFSLLCIHNDAFLSPLSSHAYHWIHNQFHYFYSGIILILSEYSMNVRISEITSIFVFISKKISLIVSAVPVDINFI